MGICTYKLTPFGHLRSDILSRHQSFVLPIRMMESTLGQTLGQSPSASGIHMNQQAKENVWWWVEMEDGLQKIATKKHLLSAKSLTVSNSCAILHLTKDSWWSGCRGWPYIELQMSWHRFHFPGGSPCCLMFQAKVDMWLWMGHTRYNHGAPFVGKVTELRWLSWTQHMTQEGRTQVWSPAVEHTEQQLSLPQLNSASGPQFRLVSHPRS